MDSVDPESVDQLFDEGWSLFDRGEGEAALAVMDRLVSTFSSAEDPQVRWCVNQALLTRASWEVIEGPSPAALADCDRVLGRFVESVVDGSALDTDPDEREQ